MPKANPQRIDHWTPVDPIWRALLEPMAAAGRDYLEFDRLARLIAGGPGTEIDEVDVERVIGIDRDRALGMMTLCVSIEDSVRPSRKQAQEHMLQAIAQKAPECFKLAQAALATPARKPRRLGARG